MEKNDAGAENAQSGNETVRTGDGTAGTQAGQENDGSATITALIMKCLFLLFMTATETESEIYRG